MEDYIMECCNTCGANNSVFESLTLQEDGMIKPFAACSKCVAFKKWINLEKSPLVQKILRQHLDEYKRK